MSVINGKTIALTVSKQITTFKLIWMRQKGSVEKVGNCLIRLEIMIVFRVN